MLSTKRGQVVRVVHSTGTSEWCYVEDRHSNKGYVPLSYLKAYQANSTAATAEPTGLLQRSSSVNSSSTQLEKVNEESSSPQ